MRIKIKCVSTLLESNVTVGRIYDVISIHGGGDQIHAVILDDNNHLYVTANAINPPAAMWQLISVTAETSEQLYPLP
jgi:hypothetical protein